MKFPINQSINLLNDQSTHRRTDKVVLELHLILVDQVSTDLVLELQLILVDQISRDLSVKKYNYSPKHGQKLKAIR